MAFATDTYYALACDPYNVQAVIQLRAIKKRADAKPLPLLIARDFDWQRIGCEHTDLTRILARRFWPGKLTMIVPCKSELAAQAGQQGDCALGLRVPGNRWLLGLLSEWDGPLVGTSANLAGMPPARSYYEVRGYFGEDLFCVDGGLAPGGEPSTVVHIVEGGLKVDREGAVKIEALHEWIVR